MARGDHIRVRRWRGLYSHHGIDMGDGTVVHFAGEPLRGRGARVCRTNLDEFLKGGTPRVVDYKEGARLPDEVVAAAVGQLSHADYSLWRNNCEHFATYCKAGRPHSRQVLRAFRVGSGVVVAAATAAVVLMARQKRNSISRDL